MSSNTHPYSIYTVNHVLSIELCLFNFDSTTRTPESRCRRRLFHLVIAKNFVSLCHVQVWRRIIVLVGPTIIFIFSHSQTVRRYLTPVCLDSPRLNCARNEANRQTEKWLSLFGRKFTVVVVVFHAFFNVSRLQISWVRQPKSWPAQDPDQDKQSVDYHYRHHRPSSIRRLLCTPLCVSFYMLYTMENSR